MLYATSKAITEHIYKGEKFGKIVKVYSVNIVYFELVHGNDYVYHSITDFRGLHNRGEVLAISEKQKKPCQVSMYMKFSQNIIF